MITLGVQDLGDPGDVGHFGGDPGTVLAGNEGGDIAQGHGRGDGIEGPGTERRIIVIGYKKYAGHIRSPSLRFSVC